MTSGKRFIVVVSCTIIAGVTTGFVSSLLGIHAWTPLWWVTVAPFLFINGLLIGVGLLGTKAGSLQTKK